MVWTRLLENRRMQAAKDLVGCHETVLPVHGRVQARASQRAAFPPSGIGALGGEKREVCRDWLHSGRLVDEVLPPNAANAPPPALRATSHCRRKGGPGAPRALHGHREASQGKPRTSWRESRRGVREARVWQGFWLRFPGGVRAHEGHPRPNRCASFGARGAGGGGGAGDRGGGERF